MHRKRPEACGTLEEIREQIDHIDREIVRAIGERRKYVLAAAAFKQTEADVAAPARFAAMLRARRQWATAEGVNADAIETLFTNLVKHFIAEEKARWSSNNPQ